MRIIRTGTTSKWSNTISRLGCLPHSFFLTPLSWWNICLFSIAVVVDSSAIWTSNRLGDNRAVVTILLLTGWKWPIRYVRRFSARKGLIKKKSAASRIYLGWNVWSAKVSGLRRYRE